MKQPSFHNRSDTVQLTDDIDDLLNDHQPMMPAKKSQPIRHDTYDLDSIDDLLDNNPKPVQPIRQQSYDLDVDLMMVKPKPVQPVQPIRQQSFDFDDDFVEEKPKSVQPMRQQSFDIDDDFMEEKPKSVQPMRQQSFDIDDFIEEKPKSVQPMRQQSFDIDDDFIEEKPKPKPVQPMRQQSFDIDDFIEEKPKPMPMPTNKPVYGNYGAQQNNDFDLEISVGRDNVAKPTAPKKIDIYSAQSSGSYTPKIRGVPNGVEAIIRADIYESTHYIILEGASNLVQSIMNHLKSTNEWTPLSSNAMVNQKQLPLQKLYQYLMRQLHRCKLGKVRWNQGVDSSYKQIEEIQIWG